MSSLVFSSGIPLFHWNHFNPKRKGYDKQGIVEQLKGTYYGNEPDFGGYSLESLFQATARYNNIKTELLESGYVGYKIYESALQIKVNAYINSQAVKELKPHIRDCQLF